MDNNQKWINEVMSQNVDASIGEDYTRLALNFVFIKDNIFENKIYLKRIVEFIYRFYIDNTNLAKVNPSPLIKNIKHYKPDDLYNYCYEQLLIWKKDKKSLLSCNKEYIELSSKIDNNNDFINKYKFIIKMMFIKFLKKEIWYDDDVESNVNENLNIEQYLSYMKNSKERNRMFEEINYCPLCEETDEKALNAIHIVKYNKCEQDKLVDKNNMLLLCDEHCKEYMNNKFQFLDNGYIKIIEPNLNLDKRMHLGIEVLNGNRKKFIERSIMVNDNTKK